MAKLDTVFNPRNIARRLVVEALVPRVVDKAEDVIDLLAGPLDEAVKGFFADLVSYMGSTTDLASRLPSVPGLRPWRPLSAEYVRRKGTSAFWVYSLAPKVEPGATASMARTIQAIRGVTRKKVAKRDLKEAGKRIRTDSLIPALARIDGTQALGGCEITMTTFDKQRTIIKQPQQEKTFRVTRKAYGHTQKYELTRLVNVPSLNLKALAIEINIRLFTNFKKSDFPVIETRLANNGVISLDNATKLIGRSSYHRPLIAPFLTYYSMIKLPALIRQVLTDQLGSAFERTSAPMLPGNITIGQVSTTEAAVKAFHGKRKK